MGDRPNLSKLLTLTPYSNSFLHIAGELSKFLAFDTK